MNILNEEIRAIRTTIEEKRRYLKENNDLIPFEKDSILYEIKQLQEELDSRLEKVKG